MNVRPFVLAVALAGLAGCASSKPGESLSQVDSLVQAIEKVHVSSELVKQRIDDSVAQLDAISTLSFSGDSVKAFGELATSVDRSIEQTADLDRCIKEMKESAEPVFKRWADDLDAFASVEMRLRSQRRLVETRSRYDAIVAAVDPALLSCAKVNQSLKDTVLFLGHDFNGASVASIRGDVKQVGGMAANVAEQFAACQAAARSYVETAALPEPSGSAPPAPANGKAPRSQN